MTSSLYRFALAFSGVVAVPCFGYAQDTTVPRTPQDVENQANERAQDAAQRAQNAAQAARPEQQRQVRGKVSDVWEAEVRKDGDDKENKVVLIETDQGQIVLADLGPSDNAKVDEGNEALVVGEVIKVSGAQRFVPQAVHVGKHAKSQRGESLAPVAQQAKPPERQRVSGKVVDKEKMSAKETKIDHELAVLEIAPRQRILVDLGPSRQLKAIEIDEGDQLTIDGQNLAINESFLLVADNVQKGNKSVNIKRQALPRGKAATKARDLDPKLESE